MQPASCYLLARWVDHFVHIGITIFLWLALTILHVFKFWFVLFLWYTVVASSFHLEVI